MYRRHQRHHPATVKLCRGGGNAAPAPAALPVFGAAPNPKAALQLFITNHDIPLSIHPSCQGVGTDFDDKTIGDYISGFLAAMTGPYNTLDAQCAAAESETTEGTVWRCDITLGHADGEDLWRWGLRFDVAPGTGTLIRESVRCTGMG